MTLLGALERLFTIPLHLACSVLVLQAFISKKFWWVGLAVLFHALADGVVVFMSKIGFSVLAIEGIIGIFSLMSIVIVFALRQPEPAADPVPASIMAPDFKPTPVSENKENLDGTRFQ
jgi:uncharacterized membrane protein YhfC